MSIYVLYLNIIYFYSARLAFQLFWVNVTFFVLIYYVCKLSSTSQFGNKACSCCCRCLYLLCRILTLKFMHFYNCYTAGSFSGWLSHGFNQRWRISFYSLHFFFTSCTRWGLLFPLLANAYPSSSLIWSGFESLHLLNARLWDFIFFHIFLIFLLAELSELIISCPSCHVFLCISFLFLFFPWHI